MGAFWCPPAQQEVRGTASAPLSAICSVCDNRGYTLFKGSYYIADEPCTNHHANPAAEARALRAQSGNYVLPIDKESAEAWMNDDHTREQYDTPRNSP